MNYSPLYCCLCHIRFKPNQVHHIISKTQVAASRKSVKQILLHLSKCAKKQLTFHDESAVCQGCYEELDNYDKAMITLMKAQKRLSAVLERSMELPGEDAIEEQAVTEELNVECCDDDDVEQTELRNEAEEDEAHEGHSSDGIPEDEEFTDKIISCDEPDCNKRFYSRNSYIRHKGKHEYRSFACPICGERKINEEYLELHMNLHEGKTEFECRYCPKTYARRTNVIRHMQLHWDKKKFQCEKCGERFSQANSLYNHKLLHEGQEKELGCDICGQIFKTRKTLKNHLNTHRPDRPRYECSICEKSFTERYTLKVHLKTHTDEDEQPAPREKKPRGVSNDHVCVICNDKFPNLVRLEAHMTEVHDVICKEEEIVIDPLENAFGTCCKTEIN